MINGNDIFPNVCPVCGHSKHVGRCITVQEAQSPHERPAWWLRREAARRGLPDTQESWDSVRAEDLTERTASTVKEQP